MKRRAALKLAALAPLAPLAGCGTSRSETATTATTVSVTAIQTRTATAVVGGKGASISMLNPGAYPQEPTQFGLHMPGIVDTVPTVPGVRTIALTSPQPSSLRPGNTQPDVPVTNAAPVTTFSRRTLLKSAGLTTAAAAATTVSPAAANAQQRRIPGTVIEKAGYTGAVDGIPVDINNVYAADWGQWVPGAASNPIVPSLPQLQLNRPQQETASQVADLIATSSQLSSKADWSRLLP